LIAEKQARSTSETFRKSRFEFAVDLFSDQEDIGKAIVVKIDKARAPANKAALTRPT
jgi:hypothetical protein